MTKKREGGRLENQKEGLRGPAKPTPPGARRWLLCPWGEANSRHLGPSRPSGWPPLGWSLLAGLSQGCRSRLPQGPQRAQWGPGPCWKAHAFCCPFAHGHPGCKTPHSAECPPSSPLPFRKTEIAHGGGFTCKDLCFRIECVSVVAQSAAQGGTELGVWEGDTGGGRVELSVWATLKRVLKKVLGKKSSFPQVYALSPSPGIFF